MIASIFIAFRGIMTSTTPAVPPGISPIPPALPPVPAAPSLTTHQVASGIARWAVQRGLLPQLPKDVDDTYLAAVDPISLPSNAEAILRHRGLDSITYNEVSNLIYLYTARKVSQKDLKSLPPAIFRKGLAYTHGVVDAVGKDQLRSQGATFATHSTSAGDHYACGSSISPGNDRSAGTLGALVRLPDGKIYGLTNNHVSALCSHVLPGTPILAPGVLDVAPGGLPPFTLGFHSHALEMHVGSVGNVDIASNTDAALLLIGDTAYVSSMQGGSFDTPLIIADPIEGMKVEKVGRTTRHTRGQIVSRSLRPAGITYEAKSYGFSGTIWFGNVFVVHGLGTEFSLAGDSGSLVVQVDDNGHPIAAVGLIFAGGDDSSAPGGARSLILPIRPILEAWGANLVGGHNV
ncbi:hypothetical protein D9N00_19140 [Pseudomonas syringae pv. actinidiae]|uniref:hypothetical protein n=1 Tax=Pseudomonas syringae TaxID=317 RepID=UPI000EF2A5B6|nr:hypothetical protein [Pseudomonas syringae]AYL16398.1 hypothetical protein D9N00_19140 [Pseudomonas syringae pv. actinidiae]